MKCEELRDDINNLKALHDKLEEQINEASDTSKGNKAKIFEILKEAETDSDQILEKYVDDFFEKNPDLLKVKLGKRIEGFEEKNGDPASVYTTSLLPNGDLLIGGTSADTLYVYQEQSDNSYKLNKINKFNDRVVAMSTLPNKNMLIGGRDNLYELKKQSDGSYDIDPIMPINDWNWIASISTFHNGSAIIGLENGTLYKCQVQSDGSYEFNSAGSIPGGNINAIFTFPSGDMLIGGACCLYECHKQSDGSYGVSKVDGFDPSVMVDAISRFPNDGNILIGGDEGTLYEYWKESDGSNKFSKIKGLKEDIKAIHALSNERILVGARHGALYECQKKSDGSYEFNEISGFKDAYGDTGANARVISALPNGNILVGGDFGTLYEATIPTKSVETLKRSLDMIIDSRLNA